MEALNNAACPVIIVTNEVGLGIMPADRLSRRYQNLLGALNQADCRSCRTACM